MKEGIGNMFITISTIALGRRMQHYFISANNIPFVCCRYSIYIEKNKLANKSKRSEHETNRIDLLTKAIKVLSLREEAQQSEKNTSALKDDIDSTFDKENSVNVITVTSPGSIKIPKKPKESKLVKPKKYQDRRVTLSPASAKDALDFLLCANDVEPNIPSNSPAVKETNNFLPASPPPVTVPVPPQGGFDELNEYANELDELLNDDFDDMDKPGTISFRNRPSILFMPSTFSDENFDEPDEVDDLVLSNSPQTTEQMEANECSKILANEATSSERVEDTSGQVTETIETIEMNEIVIESANIVYEEQPTFESDSTSLGTEVSTEISLQIESVAIEEIVTTTVAEPQTNLIKSNSIDATETEIFEEHVLIERANDRLSARFELARWKYQWELVSIKAAVAAVKRLRN